MTRWRSATCWIFISGFMVCQTLGAGTLKLPVYYQTRAISSFLYQEGLPSLSEFTICFWLSAGITEGLQPHLFGISSQAYSSNELLIGFEVAVSGWQMEVYIQDELHIFHQISYSEYRTLFLGWNKHCFTWSTGGSFKWYTDVGVFGQLRLYVEKSLPTSKIVRGPGALLMLQEQDSYMGDLDVNQLVYGKIAWINFWDREMTGEEVTGLGCRDQGNLVNWDTLEQMGEDMSHFESFPCNADELEPTKKVAEDRRQQMVFCKVAAHRLVNHTQSTVMVSSASKCVGLCVKDKDCYSVNYQTSIGDCEINDTTDLDYGPDLSETADYLYFTSRECTG